MSGWQKGTYYVVHQETGLAVAGPFHWVSDAAQFVDAQDEPADYGTASRYRLAKWGLYPRTKAGNEKLEDDLASSDLERSRFKKRGA